MRMPSSHLFDSEESGPKAREWIEYITEEVEIGRIYKGKSTLSNFGALSSPSPEGLVLSPNC